MRRELGPSRVENPEDTKAGTVWRPLREMLKTRQNLFYRKPQKKSHRFDWKLGVVPGGMNLAPLNSRGQLKTLLQILWELGDQTLKQSLEDRFSHLPDLSFKVTSPYKYGGMQVGN